MNTSLLSVLGEHLPELPDESGLADTRLADDRDQMRLPLNHGAPKRRAEELELALSAYEDTAKPGDTLRPRERQRANHRAAAHTVGLSLRLDDPRLAELERPPGGCHCALACEHLPGYGSLLEPSTHVDGVASDKRARLTCLTDDASPVLTPIRSSSSPPKSSTNRRCIASAVCKARSA